MSNKTFRLTKEYQAEFVKAYELAKKEDKKTYIFYGYKIITDMAKHIIKHFTN